MGSLPPFCFCRSPSDALLTPQVAHGVIDRYAAGMESRALTAGEIAMSRSIFGDAIDYSAVRLVRGKWWPFQPGNAAMAPNGNVYFHPHAGGWSDDFAREPLSRQGFFIHEMTHVWQAQKGGRLYLPLMRHPFCRYAYRLVPGKAFARYGLEQQAEIVRHRFLAEHGAAVPITPPDDLLPFSPAD